jgi:hypothetical protein
MDSNTIAVSTPVTEAMGARISLAGPPRGMYLVIGRETLPLASIQATGGQVVLVLNGRKLLASLPFPGYLALRGDPYIAHIGPVTIDLKRLTQVAGMLAAASHRVSP